MAALRGAFVSPETQKLNDEKDKAFSERKVAALEDLRQQKAALTASRDTNRIVKSDYDQAMKLLDKYLSATTAATTSDKLDAALRPALDNPAETSLALLELRGQGFAMIRAKMEMLTGRDDANTQLREALSSDQISQITAACEELEKWLKDNKKATEILINKQLDWFKETDAAIMKGTDLPPAPEPEEATSVADEINDIPKGEATEIAFKVIDWINIALVLLMVAIGIFMAYNILAYRPGWYRFFWAAANTFWIWIIYIIFPFAGFFFIAPFMWLIYHILSGIRSPNRPAFIEMMFERYNKAREAQLM